MHNPGIEIRPTTDIRGVASTNEIFLDNVRVPELYRIGPENRGWYVNATLMDFERSGIESVVGNERTIDRLIELFREYSKAEGPSERVTLLRHRLSQLRIEVDISRLLSYRIVWMQSEGQVPNYETSIDKVFKTELSQRIAKLGMDIFGYYSQIAPDSKLSFLEHPKWAQFQRETQNMYLGSLSGTIAQGTSEIHRNIIATRGLGLPRS